MIEWSHTVYISTGECILRKFQRGVDLYIIYNIYILCSIAGIAFIQRRKLWSICVRALYLRLYITISKLQATAGAGLIVTTHWNVYRPNGLKSPSPPPPHSPSCLTCLCTSEWGLCAHLIIGSCYSLSLSLYLR